MYKVIEKFNPTLIKAELSEINMQIFENYIDSNIKILKNSLIKKLKSKLNPGKNYFLTINNYGLDRETTSSTLKYCFICKK